MTAQSEADPETTILGIKEILEILPHRYPFLLVDRITHLDLVNNEIVGRKCVSMNEPFFQGHFPGAPIMPGVLVLEALAQTGGILAYKKGSTDKIAIFLKMDNVKFRRPVHPGDILELHIAGLFFSNKGGRVKGTASVDGKVAVEVEIGYVLVDKDAL